MLMMTCLIHFETYLDANDDQSVSNSVILR
uniref:Uncharacterized protein n=1 Tax=Arundo donax TaxID=35708 RepID=A0A0A8Z3U9_ARUDO